MPELKKHFSLGLIESLGRLYTACIVEIGMPPGKMPPGHYYIPEERTTETWADVTCHLCRQKRKVLNGTPKS